MEAFTELKRSLESLSYTEPLGYESSPLVQHLLEDLLVTTENYDLLRRRAEASERANSSAQSDVAPLRKEVSRLTRENNEVRYCLLVAAAALATLALCALPLLTHPLLPPPPSTPSP